MALSLPETAKARRLSLVALVGLVASLVWAILELYVWAPPAVIVSGVTGLATFLAGYVDQKARDAGHELYEGEEH